jgi:iduronate 2-sulfatase
MRFALLFFFISIGVGRFNAFAIAAEKPNVLLICVDDLKPNLGCYGDPLAKTPNIDRLAQRSFMFQRAYCNQAVCSPSRNALLVGLRPETLGIYDLPTNFRKSRPDAVTMPQFFKTNGYHCQALGKLFHVGHGNGEDDASWSVPYFRPMKGGYAKQENLKGGRAKPGEAPKGAAYERADVADNTYTDGQIADEVITRIEALKSEPNKPFFLGVGFLKPHLPFCAPEKYWKMHDETTFEAAAVRVDPKDAPSYAGQRGGELRSYAGIPADGDLPDALQKTLIHGYYASTSYMDAQVGRVLDALEKADLAKNTIVVLWGDHGWHLGDHGYWCKHTNFEQATRIPIIVAMPPSMGGAAGSKQDVFVESVDIYPTLCELAGFTAPSNLDGRSFANLLNNKPYQPKSYISHVYPRGSKLGRAIRTSQYRLVEWRDFSAPDEVVDLELYDYVKDPAETVNVASSQPQVVAELQKILATHPSAKPQIKEKSAQTSQPSKPAQDRHAMFLKRDINKDGFLSREEFLDKQPDPDKAPARFPKFDVNRDNQLSESEFVGSGK